MLSRSRPAFSLFRATAASAAAAARPVPNAAKASARELIVSAFGPQLHGPLREPTARIPPPEPFDMWIACRTAVAPFRESAVVVGDAGFAARAEAHFGRVFSSSSTAPSPNDDNADASAAQLSGRAESTANDSLSLRLQTIESQLVSAGAAASTAAASGRDASVSAARQQQQQRTVDICVVQATEVFRGVPDSASPPQLLVSDALLPAFAALRPFLRPHGALCLTGAVLPGTLQTNIAPLRRDWDDLSAWLRERATQREQLSYHGDGALLSTDGYEQVRACAERVGLRNVALHCFDAEYAVEGERGLALLCGLLRAMPAYRRECRVETHVDRDDGSSGDVPGPAAVSRRCRALASDAAVDPVQCFEALARMHGGGGGGAESLRMRLRVQHWMWVCDNRPRSRDAVSLRIPKRH
jgi:hypothetical protein